jgi:hypothetical protein
MLLNYRYGSYIADKRLSFAQSTRKLRGVNALGCGSAQQGCSHFFLSMQQAYTLKRDHKKDVQIIWSFLTLLPLVFS